MNFDRSTRPVPQPGDDSRGSTRRDAIAARRRNAQQVAARFLSVPDDTELDLGVRLLDQQVVFHFRNQSTGELLCEVPEQQAKALVAELRDYDALVDRCL